MRHLTMLATLPVLFVSVGSGSAAQEQPLAPAAVRSALRGVASDLSRLSAPDELQLLRELLEQLGDAPEVLDRLASKWERNLAKSAPSSSRRAKAIQALRRQAAVLGKQLERLEPDRQRALAELVLRLDDQVPAANELLGRTLHEGRWLTPLELEIERGATRISELLRAAHALEIEITTGVSDSPVLGQLYDQDCTVVRAHGVALHSPRAAHTLERMLRQALRAAALSNALLGGELEVPKLTRPRTFLLLDSDAAYDAALHEAEASQSISAEELELHRLTRMDAFNDERGWQTERWDVEAGLAAWVLYSTSYDWIGFDAQACLRAGHINWLCLNVLGTSMPSVVWREVAGAEDERSSVGGGPTFAAESLWRASRRSLYGCRSWMVQRVRAGNDPRWSASMTDQVGKIRDESLLKSTLVVAYLQERGDLLELLNTTRSPREDRVALFEEVLKLRLPEFEQRWASWLLRRPSSTGLVQTLEAADPAVPASAEHEQLLAALNELRARALAGQGAEFEVVRADPELSDGALAHARYLARNPEQLRAWPDTHEEYPDVEGFSVAGARAGLHSVVYPYTKPLAALEGWMGTFYHRLPLIEPGLFGVGIGVEPEAVVLDTNSLVLAPWREHWVAWPPDGERDVPRSFVPELPNPVPGEDQAKFGFPITLQVVRPNERGDLELRLTLHEGGSDGPEIACHRLSPTEFFFERLVPLDAWCLIPKQRLNSQTTYTFKAQGPGVPSRSWSFKTGSR